MRQRAVTAGVGVDLGAIERHGAELQHPHLAGHAEHLHEQRLDLFEEAAAECGDGVVVGMLVGGDEAERYQIVSRTLQVAAGKHADGVAVDNKAQQQPGMVRRLARAPVAAGHRPQVQSLDHFHNEPREVALRQPLIDRWRHQEVHVAVDRAEVAHVRGGTGRGKSRAPVNGIHIPCLSKAMREQVKLLSHLLS